MAIAASYKDGGPAGRRMQEMSKPTLLIQTVYFAEEDQSKAEELGFLLYEHLTRAREDTFVSRVEQASSNRPRATSEPAAARRSSRIVYTAPLKERTK